MAVEMKRRTFLKASLPVLCGGWLIPGRVLGETYPGKAFRAPEAPDALREIFGTADMAASDKIDIEAPLVAIDAGMVPVRVRSRLDSRSCMMSV